MKFDKKFYDKMDASAKRRDKLFMMQRPDDPDYGYSLNNPIMMGNIPRSYDYLERLQTENGKPLTYSRSRSYNIDLGDVQGVMVDEYELLLDGELYKRIYICPYAHNSDRAPKGLVLVNKNVPKYEKQPVANDVKPTSKAPKTKKKQDGSKEKVYSEATEKQSEDSNVKALAELLSAGVLTQAEYDQKLKQISKQEEKPQISQKDLDSLNELLELGVITEEEYAAKKDQLSVGNKGQAANKPSGIRKTDKVSVSPNSTHKATEPVKNKNLIIAAVVIVAAALVVGILLLFGHMECEKARKALPGAWTYSSSYDANSQQYDAELDSKIVISDNSELYIQIDDCRCLGKWDVHAKGDTVYLDITDCEIDGESEYIDSIINSLSYYPYEDGEDLSWEIDDKEHYYKKTYSVVKSN